MPEPEGYDPELDRVVEYFHRIWESAILVAALELDLFGALHGGPRSAAAVAKEYELDPKGVRILLDALCPAGFIEKRGDEYALTELSSRLLDPSSPSYPGPIHAGAAAPWRWTALGRLADAVRAGEPVVQRQGSMEQGFRRLVPAISHSATYAVPPLAEHLRIGKEGACGWSILDVACGQGAYGLRLLQADPTARLTLNDLPEVLSLAGERVGKAGAGDGIGFLPGSIYEVELPVGEFDLILLSHFLHSVSRADCARIIEKLAAAQKQGGYLVVHEFVPDEERRSKRFPLLFAMNMYISNGVGDTYTFSEIRGWMESAGYRGVEMIETPSRSSFVIGRMP